MSGLMNSLLVFRHFIAPQQVKVIETGAKPCLNQRFEVPLDPDFIHFLNARVCRILNNRSRFPNVLTSTKTSTISSLEQANVGYDLASRFTLEEIHELIDRINQHESYVVGRYIEIDKLCAFVEHEREFLLFNALPLLAFGHDVPTLLTWMDAYIQHNEYIWDYLYPAQPSA